MVVDRLEDAVVVPAPSVVESEAGDDRPRRRRRRARWPSGRVVAGQAHEGLRVITKGLDAGVSVIVEGLQMIRPGLPVKTEPAVLTRREADGTRVTTADAAAPPKS